MPRIKMKLQRHKNFLIKKMHVFSPRILTQQSIKSGPAATCVQHLRLANCIFSCWRHRETIFPPSARSAQLTQRRERKKRKKKRPGNRNANTKCKASTDAAATWRRRGGDCADDKTPSRADSSPHGHYGAGENGAADIVTKSTSRSPKSAGQRAIARLLEAITSPR